jgi:hypothetical protein
VRPAPGPPLGTHMLACVFSSYVYTYISFVFFLC